MTIAVKPILMEPSALVEEDIESSIRTAIETVTPYWPIDTFIATNSLSGWEQLPFADAITQSHTITGGHGYLPLATYRQFYQHGRITEEDITATLTSHLEQIHKGIDPTLPDSIKIGQDQQSLVHLTISWLLNGPDEANTPEVAIKTRGEAYSLGHETVTQWINTRMSTWCAAFFDLSQAAWHMPHRELGFYECWRKLARHERYLPLIGIRGSDQRLRSLPASPVAAIEYLLNHLGISSSDRTDYLARHLAQLPGWAGHIRWQSEHVDTSSSLLYRITLTEYLAVRLFYEAELVGYLQHTQGTSETVTTSSVDFEPDSCFQHQIEQRIEEFLASGNLQQQREKLTDSSHGVIRTLVEYLTADRQAQIWQEAYEFHYRTNVLEVLQKEPTVPLHPQSVERNDRPAAQMLFCIDARSERLRRHIEASGHYDTYGVAGFFGVAFRYRPFGSDSETDLCPALITPDHAITEVSNPEANETRQRNVWNQRHFAVREMIHTLRENMLTPFTFVEAVGWLLFIPFLAKTLLPRTYSKVCKILLSFIMPPVQTTLNLDGGDGVLAGMTIDEQAATVSQMLKMVGLTNNFARILAFCGHGSESVNNPFAAALDCGACGGQHGGVNARVAVTILNDPSIRERLRQQGIDIPDDTICIAAEHTTTTDEITIFDLDNIPTTHVDEVTKLSANLQSAGTANSLERYRELPGSQRKATRVSAHTERRATDWAQTQPEWGLAGNAAFICGRRSLTAGRNLSGRAFLHSYDPDSDVDGQLLASIMTAPLIVAEWINLHYYFATVDNATFGSGTKLLHTIVGNSGVVQGQQGDLLPGLPRQSVMVGDRYYHEPMRLLAIIEAPRSRIDTIIANHPILQNVIGNQWISLIACEPTTGKYYHYGHGSMWQPIVQ